VKIAVFHELPRGGARRSINAYASILKKLHQVDLYITDDEKTIGEEKLFSKICYFPFSQKEWKGNNWKIRLYKDTLELYKLNRLHKKIAETIDKCVYDIVLVSASQYIEAPFILKFLKTPNIFFAQDPYYRIIYDPIFTIQKDVDIFRYWYEKTNRWVRKILDKQNIKSTQLCVSPSKYIAQIFRKTYNKEVTVVHHGVDHQFFKPSNKKKDIDIFYIGSYDAVDGLVLLKKTLRYIKKKIVVRTVMKEEEWITDDKELRDLYRRAKIMFCPARREGLGLVLLEAVSSGTPVIARDEAGHREIIMNNYNGYLMSPNPKKIAAEITNLLSDPEKIHRLGQNGREDILKYWTWEKRTKELEMVLYEHIRSSLKKN